MEVFGLMFIVSFIALLTTLVVLHICKRIDKSKDDFRKKVETLVDKTKKSLMYGKSPVDEVYEVIKEHDKFISYDTGLGKDYSVESMLRQNSDETVEFIDCKWIDESWMKREVNETQEKWKESLPKHKTRIKARNKRKQRNKR